ncbi:MAG: hypothetical protein UY35_C0001G0095 [Candidatus Saccharibacteria bacterium GW2011_GWC2_48_9]|nr:MAG: hypothetical protein UY35_C0001G0095 [Candidatus Saccharibacteria bacterium GW2011_GWC2_48_9]HCH34746.1 hypothetical protein [Candidatus Saccharibacteria bacterium]
MSEQGRSSEEFNDHKESLDSAEQLSRDVDSMIKRNLENGIHPIVLAAELSIKAKQLKASYGAFRNELEQLDN